MIPYRLMYAVGFAPWERRNVPELWRPLFEGALAMEPGRALDMGCGSGRDAVHLAGRGWEVTAVEFVDKALAKAKQRAAEAGVDVNWVSGDVGQLGRLGWSPATTFCTTSAASKDSRTRHAGAQRLACRSSRRPGHGCCSSPSRRDDA
jgi:SAM-dependent methyltransferase